MDTYLFEQVVYISPLRHKMKIRKAKNGQLFDRSKKICIYQYSRLLGIFIELNQENNHRSSFHF